MSIVLRAIFLASVANLVLINSPVHSAEECRKCVKEKLEGAAAKTVAATAIGALGGLGVASLPGAVCGAVLGAVGASVDKLIEVSQCATICNKEAKAAQDKDQVKCSELMSKTSK